MTTRLELAGRDPLFRRPGNLEEVVHDLLEKRASFRTERLSGIHNPWGLAGAITEPWTFLDVCESDPVLEAARAILGQDIVLWDSELYPKASEYVAFLRERGEGRYWPLSPLAGAVMLVVPRDRGEVAGAFDIANVGRELLPPLDEEAPLYVIRLAPATSHFSRDPAHPANMAMMEERVLLNYSNRPLWLISGRDRAENDLVTGFAPSVPTWAGRVGTSTQREK